ncbi:unnamed protein product [Arctogadus glacialis]
MASHTVDDSTSAGAVEMDPMPGYVDLITKASTVMYGALRDCSACGLELSKRTLLDNAYITWNEIFLFCFCAFLWTQIRQGLTECLFKGGFLLWFQCTVEAAHGRAGGVYGETDVALGKAKHAECT